MPQMAPMNWLALFFMFALILLMFNCLNYFSFTYKSKSSELMKKTYKNNWKW